MGPYEVVTAFDNGSVKIKTIDGSEISFIVKWTQTWALSPTASKHDFIQIFFAAK